jgi:hypothetical protein
MYGANHSFMGEGVVEEREAEDIADGRTAVE